MGYCKVTVSFCLVILVNNVKIGKISPQMNKKTLCEFYISQRVSFSVQKFMSLIYYTLQQFSTQLLHYFLPMQYWHQGFYLLLIL